MEYKTIFIYFICREEAQKPIRFSYLMWEERKTKKKRQQFHQICWALHLCLRVMATLAASVLNSCLGGWLKLQDIPAPHFSNVKIRGTFWGSAALIFTHFLVLIDSWDVIGHHVTRDQHHDLNFCRTFCRVFLHKPFNKFLSSCEGILLYIILALCWSCPAHVACDI